MLLPLRLLLLWCTCHVAIINAVYSPVILIPGTGGNQLEARLDNKPHTPAWYCSKSTDSYFTLWLDMASLLPFKINCWVDNIQLEWDMVKMTASNPQGVLTRVPGFGNTSTMETLDTHGLIKYMKPLVDHLTALGYRKGKDLRGAPYDFRFSPETLPHDYHEKLKKMIEETYTANINEPVTLISHSYGCIVTHYFLTLQTAEWKAKFVKQWIPLAGPFGGTKTQVHLYSSGYLEGNLHLLVNRLTLRDEQRSSLSNLYMLPSLAAWPGDAIIAKTPYKTYTMADIDDFLRNVGIPRAVQMRRAITNSTALMNKAPGVAVYCFHGHIAESTMDHVVFGSSGFPDNPYSVVNGGGDETVNEESLRLCEKFAALQKQPVKMTEVAGVNHGGVLGDAGVLTAIDALLKGGKEGHEELK